MRADGDTVRISATALRFKLPPSHRESKTAIRIAKFKIHSYFCCRSFPIPRNCGHRASYGLHSSLCVHPDRRLDFGEYQNDGITAWAVGRHGIAMAGANTTGEKQ